MATPVLLEIGSKKVFACALDWPGWARAAKTEDDALAALGAYAPRYAEVPGDAGVRWPKTISFEVVERVAGSASTDFGVPGAICDHDRRALTKQRAQRNADLVAAAWGVLDRVAKGAPASLRKGPRGGGRDRDKMLEHVLGADVGYAKMVGLKLAQPALDDRGAISAFRDRVLDLLRSARSGQPDRPKGWPPRYAARRIAWHALDHAWEMQDRSES